MSSISWTSANDGKKARLASFFVQYFEGYVILCRDSENFCCIHKVVSRTKSVLVGADPFEKHKDQLNSARKSRSIFVPGNSTASLKLHVMFVSATSIVFINLLPNIRKSFFPIVSLAFLLRFAAAKSCEEHCAADEKVASGSQKSRGWLSWILHVGAFIDVRRSIGVPGCLRSKR